MPNFPAVKERLTRSSFVRAIAFIPKTILNKWQDMTYARSMWPKDIERFKYIHKGESCFIIGNGPSLTIEDLEKLKGKVTFGSNYLFRLFEKTSFRPTYYVAGDPFFFPEGFKELQAYGGVEEYFMAQKNDDIYVPNLHRINVSGPFTIVKGSMKNDEFSNDVSHHFALSYTVTFYSLQLAVYMGFKTIYLVGVDHKYAKAVDSHGRMKTNEDSPITYADGIDPSARPGWNYVDSTTHSYIAAKKFADDHGIQILNATRGGALNVFDRVDFDEAIQRP